MPFLLAFWKPIAAGVAIIALLIAVGVVKHKYDDGKRDEGRAEIQALWDADRHAAQVAVAEKEQLWQDERRKREQAEQEAADERSKRAVVAATAARGLPRRVAGVAVPAAAVRVLNDAIGTGNPAATAGPAAKPAKEAPAAAEGADSTVGLLTEWGVQCIAAYDEARGMVTGWQAFYQTLRQ